MSNTVLGVSSNLIHKPREVKDFPKVLEPLRSKAALEIPFPEHKCFFWVPIPAFGAR